MAMFWVDIAGEYGDEDQQISLLEDNTELVMWVSDEWKEDPSLVAVIANAIKIGYEQGPDAIRELLKAR